jgi:hypothetical protein
MPQALVQKRPERVKGQYQHEASNQKEETADHVAMLRGKPGQDKNRQCLGITAPVNPSHVGAHLSHSLVR